MKAPGIAKTRDRANTSGSVRRSRSVGPVRSRGGTAARAVRNASSSSRQLAAISCGVDARFDLLRAGCSIPARMSIGILSCSYSYGGCRQRSGRVGRRNIVDERHAGEHRPERVAIGDVDLAAAARLLRMLLERRLEDRGTEVGRRAGRAVHLGARSVRLRSTALQRARTAASCRDPPTAGFPRRAPCPDRRSRCRASACSATA